jgi:Protein of unknown function (DUF1573)
LGFGSCRAFSFCPTGATAAGLRGRLIPTFMVRRFQLGWTAGAFAFWCTLLSSPCAFGGTARATLPEILFDAGRVLKGSVIEHAFVVVNEGDSPLVIDEIQLTPPIAMTGATPSIAPGEQGTIRVRVDTSAVSGAFEGQIVASVNDPERPRLTLKVAATVYPSIEVVPRPAFFLVADRGQTSEQSLEIVNHGSDPVRIERVESAADRFTTRVDTVEDGRRYRLTLVFNARGTGGRRTDPILITTSSPATPTLTIAANTFVRDRVYTFPESVDFGSIPVAALDDDAELLRTFTQTLMVYRKGHPGFEVKVTTDVAALKIDAAQGPGGDQWQITMSLNAELVKPGVLNGSIFIETNDPEFPRLKVPVVGKILEPFASRRPR